MQTAITGRHFTHTNGSPCAVLRAPLPPLADDSAQAWVQVIPGEGSFEGHPDGAFEFTAQVIDRIVENFDKRQTPVAMDFEHDKHNPSIPGHLKLSSGRVLGVERRDGDDGAQLWTRCEFTERAAEQIRAKERNFTSPVVAFEHPGAVDGEDQGATLLVLSLTDTPFLDGQDPIRLSSFVALTGDHEVKKMADDNEDEKKLTDGDEEKVELTDGDEDEVKLADGDEEKVELAEDDADKVELQDEPTADLFLDAVASGTGLDRSAALAMLMENLDAIVARIGDKADLDGNVSDQSALSELKEDRMKNTVKKLTDQVASLEARAAKRDENDAAALKVANEQRIDQLVSEGFISEGKRTVALSLLSSNPTEFDKMYDGTEKVVPIGKSQAEVEGPKDPKSVKLSDLTDRQRQDYMNLTNMNWVPEKAMEFVLDAKRGN